MSTRLVLYAKLFGFNITAQFGSCVDGLPCNFSKRLFYFCAKLATTLSHAFHTDSLTPETSMSNQHTWCGFYVCLFFTAIFPWCKNSQKWDCCRNIYTLTMKVLSKFVSCVWLTVPLLENGACKITHQDFLVDLSLNLASAPACPLCLSFKCVI